LNESESEQGTSKDDSTKDSDSLLFIGEDFPDIGDNSEKLTDDFGEMSQAGVKTSVRTDTEMISTGIKSTQGLKVGSSIGVMDQVSELSPISGKSSPINNKESLSLVESSLDVPCSDSDSFKDFSFIGKNSSILYICLGGENGVRHR
jgi:hypothetical protein